MVLTGDTNTSTKEQLLQTAALQFSKYGYQGTSLADITSQCNIQKPSFFAHFASKEALAFAALENIHHHCEEHLLQPLLTSPLSTADKLAMFVRLLKQYLTDRTDYKLPMVLAIEKIGQQKAFKTLIKLHYENWLNMFASLADSSYNKEQRLEKARHALITLKGSMILPDLIDEKASFDDSLWAKLTATLE